MLTDAVCVPKTYFWTINILSLLNSRQHFMDLLHHCSHSKCKPVMLKGDSAMFCLVSELWPAAFNFTTLAYEICCVYWTLEQLVDWIVFESYSSEWFVAAAWSEYKSINLYNLQYDYHHSYYIFEVRISFRFVKLCHSVKFTTNRRNCVQLTIFLGVAEFLAVNALHGPNSFMCFLYCDPTVREAFWIANSVSFILFLKSHLRAPIPGLFHGFQH